MGYDELNKLRYVLAYATLLCIMMAGGGLAAKSDTSPVVHGGIYRPGDGATASCEGEQDDTLRRGLRGVQGGFHIKSADA
jgi:hypothetical protein